MQAKFRIGQTVKIRPSGGIIAFETGTEMVVKDIEPVDFGKGDIFVYTLDTGSKQTETTNWLTRITEHWLEE